MNLLILYIPFFYYSNLKSANNDLLFSLNEEEILKQYLLNCKSKHYHLSQVSKLFNFYK